MSQELPPQINANDPGAKNKGFMANLTKGAGAATKFVALQGERTKLKSLTLPAAYRALGKDCLQQKRHLDCVVELTSQLRSVLDEIKQLAEVAPGQPVPQSFTDKAKAAGKYAVDVARQKQLGMRRDSLIGNVGKAIYEKHSNASGPIELVGPIASSIARIAQIDTEIGQQSQVVKGSMVKPKLGWLIPSKRKIAIGVGVAFAAFVLLAFVSHKITQGVKRQLSEGRQLWDEGKHEEASARFKEVIGEHPSLIPSFDRPIIFKQVIERDSEKGNKASAKILIEQALSMNVPLDLTLPQAKEILIAVEAEKERMRGEAEEKQRQVAKEQLTAKERQVAKEAGKERPSDSPVDFSSLDYSKGPNGEILEEFYSDGTTYRGYIPDNPPKPDDLKWRGLRQPVLEKASKKKSFVTHGIQTYWVKRPNFPTERAERDAMRDGKEPPSYSTDGCVRQKVWHVWAGKMHGVDQLFDSSGKILLTENTFANGEQHGPATAYWPTGKMKIKQFWKNGKLHGSQTQWYEGGQIADTSTFANHLEEGIWTKYYLNGQKKIEATFVKGEVVGKVKEWDDKGNDVSVDLSGTLATGDGYTERILSLHPNVLRKFDAFKQVSKKNDKPRYQAGTVDDLLQAMSLLSSVRGLPVTNGNASYGNYSSLCGNPQIPEVLWEQVFLSPKATAVKEDFVDTMWTINCTSGTVRMFGSKSNQNHGILISTLWWDNYNKEFCKAK